MNDSDEDQRFLSDQDQRFLFQTARVEARTRAVDQRPNISEQSATWPEFRVPRSLSVRSNARTRRITQMVPAPPSEQPPRVTEGDREWEDGSIGYCATWGSWCRTRLGGEHCGRVATSRRRDPAPTGTLVCVASGGLTLVPR